MSLAVAFVMCFFLVAFRIMKIVPFGWSPRCFAICLALVSSIRICFSFFCFARMMAWASPMSIPVISAMALDFFRFSSEIVCMVIHLLVIACSMVYASGCPFALPWLTVSFATSGGICIWLNRVFRR